MDRRLGDIDDYYRQRQDTTGQAAGSYRPLPPERLYLPAAEWRERLDAAALARLTPFSVPDTQDRERNRPGPVHTGR